MRRRWQRWYLRQRVDGWQAVLRAAVNGLFALSLLIALYVFILFMRR